MLSSDQKRELVQKLHQIGAIQIGKFTLVSGTISPIYIDLRIFVSYPRYLKQVAQIYADMLTMLEYDRLAGIPYAALPLTAVVALEMNEPWIFPRKETKQYGLKKSIEGKYKKGETVVVIDDVVVKGDSKLLALKPLLGEGLVVKDFVVLIDYEMGGGQLLQSQGYNLHAALTMREITDSLLELQAIDKPIHSQITGFLKT